MESNAEMQASRRQFLHRAGCAICGLAVTSTTGLTACAARAGLQPHVSAGEVRIDVGDLKEVGAWRVSDVTGPDGAPVLVVHEADGVTAFSMQCTHSGCTIDAPVDQRMTCPCHDSQFALSGEVLRGPAAQPLGRYRTAYDHKTHMLTVSFG